MNTEHFMKFSDLLVAFWKQNSELKDMFETFYFDNLDNIWIYVIFWMTGLKFENKFDGWELFNFD